MNAITSYLKHVREEFTHIVWPSNRTAISHTVIVLLIAVVITVLIGVLDYFFGSVVSRIAGG